jgi:hypothetical protein
MKNFTILVIADLSGPSAVAVRGSVRRRVITLDKPSFGSLQSSFKKKYQPSSEQGTTCHSAADSSWLGLKRLLENVSAKEVTVKVWDASKTTLLRDLCWSPELESSMAFRAMYSEGVGTFGGSPVGLVVGDFYLTNDRDDLEILRRLPEVCERAGAPFVCGVSSELFSCQSFDDIGVPVDGSRLPKGWESAGESPFSDLLVPLMPRWKSVARGQVRQWLHPAYLVAAIAAGAMKPAELPEVVRNLVPAWAPAVKPEERAYVPMDSFWDIEFEWNCSDAVRQDLAGLGLNVLSQDLLLSPGKLADIVPMRTIAKPQPDENLARRLLAGRVFHDLQQRVRSIRTSDRASVVVPSLHEFLQEYVPTDTGGSPLFTIKHIGVGTEELAVALSWCDTAGGGMEKLNLQVPGLIDDRRPAGSRLGL